MGKERNLVIDQRLTNFTPVTRIKGEVNNLFVRRMTPRDWARLQGFPDSFQIVVSDVQAYKQFGNSVAIPVVKAVAKEVIKALDLSKKSNVNVKFTDWQGKQLELFT
jgi:DNA (cytosine-5)-methyltransferase 1